MTMISRIKTRPMFLFRWSHYTNSIWTPAGAGYRLVVDMLRAKHVEASKVILI